MGFGAFRDFASSALLKLPTLGTGLGTGTEGSASDIVHAEGVRFAISSSAPQARVVNLFGRRDRSYGVGIGSSRGGHVT
jgi:hypothetical protein